VADVPHPTARNLRTTMEASHTIHYHKLLTYFTFLRFNTFLSVQFSNTCTFDLPSKW
jgi:hypothetical protein